MKGFQLVSSLLRQSWLIDRRYADSMMPVIHRILMHDPVTMTDVEASEEESGSKIKRQYSPAVFASVDGVPMRMTLSKAAMQGNNVFASAPQGSIAVIPVSGAIMQEDYCGAPGTKTLAKWVKDANAAENIIATLLLINSPGGSVAGTFEFADVIRSSSKPVLSFVEGLAASAGYGIASAGREVWASHRTVEVGSIGTMIQLADYSGWLENEGIKEHFIYATASTDKNATYHEALKGNYKPMIKEILDPTNAIFHDTVKSNRPGLKVDAKSNEPLTGKVYLAETAMDLGLIDRIGTFEQAVERLQELAAEGNTNRVTSSYNHNHNMKKLLTSWATLVAFFGFTSAEGATETNEEMTSEHLTRLNAELSRLQAVEADFNALKQTAQTTSDALTKATDDLTAAQSTITTLTTDRDAWKATAEAYGSQPGAIGTTPPKQGTDPISATPSEADEVEKEVNAMANVQLGL